MNIIAIKNWTTKERFRIAVSCFFFIQGIVFATWASRIPDIKSALHLNDAALGSVLFAIPLGQMAAMALSGYLVSHFGSRKMLILASILYPVFLIPLGLATSVWMLSVGLFLFGMAANLCNISVNTQGVDVEHLYKQSIMATFHGLWSLAGFTGGMLSMAVVAIHLSPLIHFCIVCFISLLLMVIMRNALVKRDIKPEQTTEKKRFVMPDRYILMLGVMAFGCMACEGCMYDWSGVYFAQVVEAPQNLVRLGYIVCLCTMTLGRFMADRMITRFGAYKVVFTCGLLITIGLLISIIWPNLIAATLGFLIVGFGISATVPICYSMAGRSKIMSPGVALATVSTIGFLGFLLGPPVIGFIAQALNLRWSFALIAGIGILISILSPALKTKEQ